MKQGELLSTQKQSSKALIKGNDFEFLVRGNVILHLVFQLVWTLSFPVLQVDAQSIVILAADC